MMLEPEARSLYTSILRPPAGYAFTRGLAATYSLDLNILLNAPLHLLLFSDDEKGGKEERYGIALLEALRRISERLVVFCQQGQTHVPGREHVLFSFLEDVVVEVNAPNGGVFHPKFWALRFDDPEGVKPPAMRLAVLSRNLTQDRSWDISLVLDGKRVRGRQYNNRNLVALLESLPGMAAGGFSETSSVLLAGMTDDLSRTRWELPEGFERLEFHVIGLNNRRWLPKAGSDKKTDQLVVISPFLDKYALTELAGTSKAPIALVSSVEELAKLANKDSEALDAFGEYYVLAEPAEGEGEEEGAAGAASLRGLHAKAYITKVDGHTHYFVGSANATNAAIINAKNVEFMAELAGRPGKVGNPRDLLGEDSLGGMLDRVDPGGLDYEVDTEREAAEDVLENARRALIDMDMRATCEPFQDKWRMALTASRPQPMKGIASCKAWPITFRSEQAVDALPCASGETVLLPPCAAASITGFMAFELAAGHPDQIIRFVLNLPLDNLPEVRHSAVIQSVIANREGFVRYLLMLLGDFNEGDALPQSRVNFITGSSSSTSTRPFDDMPLLEEMTLAFCRDRERLKAIRKLLDDLLATPEGREVVPEEFISLWSVFDEAAREVAD